MTILRIISLVLFWLVARNFYRAWRLARGKPGKKPAASEPGPGSSTDPDFLTDQDITDADYEEIP